nr:MAG TPA: hypothetical protein [Caudoviricetes sp.]
MYILAKNIPPFLLLFILVFSSVHSSMSIL